MHARPLGHPGHAPGATLDGLNNGGALHIFFKSIRSPTMKWLTTIPRDIKITMKKYAIFLGINPFSPFRFVEVKTGLLDWKKGGQ